MKHPKQNKRAPQTHPSALAVPSYYRILVKHGLIEKTLSIPDAYEVFLKVGADLEVQKLRRKVAHGNKMKHIVPTENLVWPITAPRRARVTCTATLHLVDFKCASSFGEAALSSCY